MKFWTVIMVVAGIGVGCDKGKEGAGGPFGGKPTAVAGSGSVTPPTATPPAATAPASTPPAAGSAVASAPVATPPAATPPAATPPAAGSGAPAAPETAPTALVVGDRVTAKWTNGSWYPGKISAVNADGTYNVNYDDGDKSKNLPLAKVKKRVKSTGGGGGGTSTTTKATPSDSPCPGPGLTRRCNGRCVNIQEDSNNCGGCGTVCSGGKRCDGHMFCRDADGNL